MQKKVSNDDSFTIILATSVSRQDRKMYNLSLVVVHYTMYYLPPQWPRAVGATTAKLHYEYAEPSGEHSSNKKHPIAHKKRTWTKTH